MAFDKSQLDALQAYHVAHAKEIYTRVFSNQLLKDNFMVMTVKDKMILPDGNSTEVLQGFQPGHHSKGDISLGGRLLETRLVKADNTIVPRALHVDFYLAFMKDSGNDPRKYPYEAWVLDMIYNQMYEDLVLSALWDGVYAAPTPGTPNNAADVIDGGLKLLNDEITATNLVPTITGAIVLNTAVSQIETFVKSNLLKASERAAKWLIYCSQDLLDKYQTNYRALYGANIHANDPMKLTGIDGTKVYLKPQDGLLGDELIMTKPNNFVVGLDGDPFLNITYFQRYLYYELDWAIGLQYRSNQNLYVNDQL